MNNVTKECLIELTFNSTIEIKNYLLKLLEDHKQEFNNYCIIKKIIDNTSIELFEAKKSCKNSNDNKYFLKGFYTCLYKYNSLINQLQFIFGKDNDFNYELISKYYFYSKQIQRLFIINSLKLIPNYSKEEIEKEFNTDIIHTISVSLFNLRRFYIIHYKSYNNTKNLNENEIRENDYYNILLKIGKCLSKESIIAIFKIKKVTSCELKNNNLITEIDNIISDLNHSKLNIKIAKQEMNLEFKKIINTFISNLDSFKNTYKDYSINDVDTNIIDQQFKIILLQFNILYKKAKYNIKITQTNLKLYSYIYKNNSTHNISIDRIYSAFDFSRIFYIINELNEKGGLC